MWKRTAGNQRRPGHTAACSRIAHLIPTEAGISSAFTKLDLDRCQLTLGATATTTWRCNGYAGVPLYVDNGDERFDLTAGNEGGEDTCTGSPHCAFNYPGDKIEWRVKDGCRIAKVDGALPNANVIARQAADASFNGNVRCIDASPA